MIARNENEKCKFLPLLKLENSQNVFEIGCGVGLFTDIIKDKGNSYLGIDFSSEVINVVKNKFYSYKNIRFAKLDFSNDTISSDILQDLIKDDYNVILSMGLRMYLNDSQILTLHKNLMKIFHNKDVKLLFKEFISITEKRLTLKFF